jgi:hypothetical protein
MPENIDSHSRPIGTDQSVPPTCAGCGQPYAYIGEYLVQMPAFKPQPAYTFIHVAWWCRTCKRGAGYMKDPPD